MSEPPQEQQLYYRGAGEMEELLEPLSDLGELTCISASASASQVLDSAFSLECLAAVDRAQLFRNIKRWAMDALRDGPCTVRHCRPDTAPGSVDVRVFTAKECRGILANALLGNVRTVLRLVHRSDSECQGEGFFGPQI